MEIQGFSDKFEAGSPNFVGCGELIRNEYIKSRFDRVIEEEIESENQYFNLLILFSEYSFAAFNKDAMYLEKHNFRINSTKTDTSFNNLFHYDYVNDIDYEYIYSSLVNPLIRNPVYDLYCTKHKHEKKKSMCLDCLERYRVVTRNLIPLMKTLRKDLCSIYFIDVLYDLIRFENRNLYAFITYMINQFSDGSSFKSFASSFGKRRIHKLLKTMNRPFRRIDFKMVLKKYIPLVYSAFTYCANTRIDCLDRVYDYMLHQGLSMFKIVPSELVVVGYMINDKYRIDILKTTTVLDFAEDQNFQIGSHPLLEGLNFGFYEYRLEVYNDMNWLDEKLKANVRKMYANFTFSGQSIFTGRMIHSTNAIVIGFLKKSINTFQNFRLDIHIESIITNRMDVDKLRFIGHDKWNFEDNEADDCYA